MHQLLRWAAVAVLCGYGVRFVGRTPTPVPATAPAPEFSAERALEHVRRITAKPHSTGSPGHAEVRAYLTGEIGKLGLSPEIQSTTAVGTRYAVAGHVENVLVRVPGTRPGGLAVLLAAHYDAVAAGPGAGDDASGTAALLETLRALKAGPQLLNDVIFLWTDAEEQGLLGAAAFVREHPWAKDAGVILNFEARGTGGPSFMFETGPGNLDVVRVLGDATDARGTSISTTVYRRLPNDTDLSEFSLLGTPAMNFAMIGGAERYHTSQDDVAHMDLGSLQHHGAQALALARAFASEPLPRPTTPDAVFFFLPALGTFAYAEPWALYFAIATLLVALVPLVRQWRASTRARAASALVGAAGALLLPAMGGVIGFTLGGAFVRLHQEIGSGRAQQSGAYALTIAMIAAVIAVALRRASLWRTDARVVGSSALVVWSLISVGVAVQVPGASFLFTWPILAAILAEPLGAGEPRYGVPRRLAAAAVVTVFIAPLAWTMSLVALGLDSIGGAVLGVLVGMAASLLGPMLATPEDGWKPTAALVIVPLCATIYGTASVRTSAERPVGANLVFAVDADSGRAFASGMANGPVGSKWLDGAVTGNALEWVRLPVWLRRLGGGREAIPLRPYESASAPRVTVLKDSATAAGRMVRVRVRPGARNVLDIRMDIDSMRVVSTEVDGRPLRRDRLRRTPTRWRLDFVAPPDSGFTLAITVEGAAAPRLNLTQVRPGLAVWPLALRQRTPEVVPYQDGDVTVDYASVVLEVPARPRSRR